MWSAYQAKDNYRSLLTGRELQCLDDAEEEYRKIYQQSPEQDPDLVIYLGDTFCVRKTWSGTSRTRCPIFFLTCPVYYALFVLFSKTEVKSECMMLITVLFF
jgi:hypothetical protein